MSASSMPIPSPAIAGSSSSLSSDAVSGHPGGVDRPSSGYILSPNPPRDVAKEDIYNDITTIMSQAVGVSLLSPDHHGRSSELAARHHIVPASIPPPPHESISESYQKLLNAAEEEEKIYGVRTAAEIVREQLIVVAKNTVRLINDVKEESQRLSVLEEKKRVEEKKEVKDVNMGKEEKERDSKEVKERSERDHRDVGRDDDNDGDYYGCSAEELKNTEVEFAVGGESKRRVIKVDSKTKPIVFGGRYPVDIELAKYNERLDSGNAKCSRVNMIVMTDYEIGRIFVVTVGGCFGIRTVKRSSNKPCDEIKGRTAGFLTFGFRERAELMVGYVPFFINPKVCVICMEEARQAQVDCRARHNRFCQRCIETVLSGANPRCPICRDPITTVVGRQFNAVSQVYVHS